MTTSLCIIVKNEEIALPRCLNSVKDVVEEIVVLDTGSSDRTVEVARQSGAKIYHFNWCNDFSAARNEALKYVTGDWVLVLDADEILVPEIIPDLQQVMKGDRFLVVNLLRQEVGAVQSPYSLVSRLFRRHQDIYFARPYHAMIDDSVTEILRREPHWQIANLDKVAILHYGYQQQQIAQKDKFVQAEKIMSGFLASHPDDPYVCSKLGALYVQTGKVVPGIELLERGLESAANNEEILYELHYHLGLAYSYNRQITQAITSYQTAAQLNVSSFLKIGAYNNLGNLWQKIGNLQQAKSNYLKILQIDPNFALGYYNLGITLKAMGQFVEAIAAYERAIQLNPEYAQAYQNLGVVLLKLGRVRESLAAFQQAIALYESSNPAVARQLSQNLQEMGF
ncbi:tetratricopeptide repeat protein [Scytonema millei]|uniref:tetratricopeptide repeat protein n=1 Tax=Scytonema millei TaxID=1245922 RepID=UPI000A41E529|nr:tetratricopeptide repeat protein [Scytonema millei]